MKFVIKELPEVFSLEFVSAMENVMIPGMSLSKNSLRLIMDKISEYERRNGLRFVCFQGTELLIFREEE